MASPPAPPATSHPHRQWLASQIISDQQTITYRVLSRALKLHVNAAKLMLYDFHSHENAKKPGSVHATYLLMGRRKEGEEGRKGKETSHIGGGVDGADDDDEELPVPSSPPPLTSSMVQSSLGEKDDGVTSAQTIALVREEGLDGVRSSYDSISSIHIYSLSPHRLPDIQALADCGRHLYATYRVKEDPLQCNSTYGVIVNKNARRRTEHRPPPAPKAESKATIKAERSSVATSKTNGAKAATEAAPPQQTSNKREDTSRPSSAASSVAPASTTIASTKPPKLKRDVSDIFKSFAKAKTKPTPKLTQSKSDSSVNGNDNVSTPDTEAANPLHNDDDDEGESEEEALFLDTNTHVPAKKRSSAGGKAERAAKLRKMMDDDDGGDTGNIGGDKEASDEEMVDEVNEVMDADEANNDASTSSHQGNKEKPTKVEDSTAIDWSDSDPEAQKGKARTKNGQKETPQPSHHGHRRRGKRKVIKKKTVKDDEGYLVTRQEAIWESFSEDDPEPGRKDGKNFNRNRKPDVDIDVDMDGEEAGPEDTSLLSSPPDSNGAGAGAGADSTVPNKSKAKSNAKSKGSEKEKEKEKGKGGGAGNSNGTGGDIMSFFQKK